MSPKGVAKCAGSSGRFDSRVFVSVSDSVLDIVVFESVVWISKSHTSSMSQSHRILSSSHMYFHGFKSLQ